MSGKVVLTYFDGRGMGEFIRALLTYGDIEFEDKRIPGMEAWLAMKDGKKKNH